MAECKNLDDLRLFLTAKVPSVDVNGEEPDFSVVDLGYTEEQKGENNGSITMRVSVKCTLNMQVNEIFCCGHTPM